MKESSKPSLIKKLSDYFLSHPAIAIPLLSAIGYFAAFAFEVGYLDYFGVSYQLAHVELSSFIFMTLVTIPFIFYLVAFYDSFLRALLRKFNDEDPTQKYLKKVIIIFLGTTCIFVPLSLFTNTPASLLAIIGIPLFYIIEPIISHPKTKGGYRTKIIASEEVSRSQSNARSKIMRPMTLVFTLAILLSGFFFTAGDFFARGQHDFTYYKADDNSKYVILREYESKIVSVKLNSDNTLSKDCQVLFLPTDKPIQLFHITVSPKHHTTQPSKPASSPSVLTY